MKRLLLLLPLGVVVGLLLPWHAARCQQGSEFGVLKTATPASLPVGIAPAGSVGREAPSQAANPFPLTVEAGPWMICVAHYAGPDGSELARQVALQLRETHHLNAFIYNRGDEERRKQDEEWEKLKASYPPGTPLRRRRVRIQDQYAVLVGGFKDFDTASAFLPNIKSLPLPKLSLAGDKLPYDTWTALESDPETKKTVIRRAPVNPFSSALVVRNPLIPTQSNKPKWDPLWKRLNADEKYSLLKNPHAWTLVVKEYAGSQVIEASSGSKDKGVLGWLGFGSSGGTLALAGQRAEALAEFLRNPQFGFETWVLHTRNSSVVTVGGFTGPEDPALRRTQWQLSKLKFSSNKVSGDPIGLLPNPIPIEVPRP